MKIRYNLDDVEGGTAIKIRIQSVGDVSRVAMPPAILAGKVREDLEGSLKKLKKHMENGHS
jgi:hypothetical protein